MRKIIYTFLIITFSIGVTDSFIISSQTFINGTNNVQKESDEITQPFYSASPNHREIVLKSFELAVVAGFDDPSLTIQEIKDRLEAGAYSEDFEAIPGIIGDHFPNPWGQGPEFDFGGYYSFSKIPYGSYRSTLSGWYRGLNHGYDPVQEFKWPGANSTTVEWANYSCNSYIWENAVQLYLSGEKAKAYQCLGHILHLLADLSIPSHVKIVNHGMDVVELNQGTPLNPDKLELIVDEYEHAISGGLIVPSVVYIPNVLNEFRSAINLVDTNNIPWYSNWQDYLIELVKYTYNHPLVNQFYLAPAQSGGWGSALDENGIIKNPITYATLPLVEINNEWFELKIKSTATATGPILPENKMIVLCNDFVPKAVEYGAGLLLKFYDTVTDVESEIIYLNEFVLFHNYPNPFNPSTKISWHSPVGSHQTLIIYDVLGNEVATLVDEYKPVGNHEVEWNASNYPSGVYFYQLKTENFIDTKKMILIQ
ncbi:MAG: T9SS type A sorting domain-containing protein [bacterium]|nr:T9SS type A sorting domain-containing protein [bacterium]